jgi:antitoxin component of MazEF toxin-antitoxin module
VGLKDKRKIMHVGNSEAVTLPANLVKGEEASIAADRLIIMDPRGEISEDDLLEFLETHIEPIFWEWLRKRNMEAKK